MFRKYASCIMLDNVVQKSWLRVLSIKVKVLRNCRKGGYIWYAWGLSIRVKDLRNCRKDGYVWVYLGFKHQG